MIFLLLLFVSGCNEPFRNRTGFFDPVKIHQQSRLAKQRSRKLSVDRERLFERCKCFLCAIQLRKALTAIVIDFPIRKSIFQDPLQERQRIDIFL